MKVKLYNDIKDDMQMEVLARQDRVTDFSEGSIISAFLSAAASELEELYLRADEGFKNNMEALIMSMTGFQKRAGAKAKAQIVFYLAKPLSFDVTVPSGLRIAGKQAVFVTSAAALIAKGQTQSDPVSALCQSAGSQGNAAAGEICRLLDSAPYISGAANLLPASGGCDKESDEEAKRRFIEYFNGLGGSCRTSILSAAKSVEGAAFAKIVEHFPPQGVYNFTLYIDDGTGSPSAELLEAVRLAVEGGGTPENPGFKACGLQFKTAAPERRKIDLALTVFCGKQADAALLASQAASAAAAYIDGLNMGENLVMHKLISHCLEIEGIENVQVSSQCGAVIAAAAQEVLRAGQIKAAAQ